MGVLEVLLVVAVVLKWLGVASFVAVSWWTIFGCYALAYALIVFVMVSAVLAGFFRGRK